MEIVRQLTNKKYDLNYIDENCEVVGSASVYFKKAIESNSGRSESGLVCLWRKDSQFTVDRIITTTNYIVMSLRFGSLTLVMVTVYLRSDIWEVRTLNAYLDALSELENIINSMQFDSIYLVGYFNADPFIGRAWGNLINFIERNNLECFNKKLMDDDSCTFVSYGNKVTKWLDHMLGGESNYFKAANTLVLYNKVGSDHLPLETNILVSPENAPPPVENRKKEISSLSLNEKN